MPAPPPPPTSTGPSPARGGANSATAEPVVLGGRYRLERRIGQGGMSEVWVATDLQLDRRVAVKWLKPSLASDPVVAERFRREAISVAKLTHPNIVAVHDVFEHDGRQAVVMQLVDGKSLRQLLDGQRRLGPDLTVHIGACVAAALDEAHRAGLVHRDVKPGNILLTSDGRVLLTDFGIAKGLDVGDDDLTSDNVMMGTAKYLSPEQVRGRRLDGRADLYSLGLVLYECLAGRVPFLGQSDADTALARLQRDPTDLHQLRPTLPPALVALIHRTLARNPAHRPADGATLRTALLAVDTSPVQVDATPAEPPSLADPARLAMRRAQGPASVAGIAPASRPPAPAIPGEPGGLSAAPEPGGDRTPVTRDRTPAAGTIRGHPARGMEQRWTPSLVVVGLLLVMALAVALGLWIAIRVGDPQPADPVTGDESAAATEAGDGDGDAAATDEADVDDAADVAAGEAPADEAEPPPEPTGPARLDTVRAWDPDGDNGGENDAQAARALADGDPSTAWATECYANQYMGGKSGVGLIVALTGPDDGTISVDVQHGPYQLEVYASAAESAPNDLPGWGARIGERAFGPAPTTITRELPAGTRHALLWLRELGADDACTSSNPYRGRLGEVTFTSAG